MREPFLSLGVAAMVALAAPAVAQDPQPLLGQPLPGLSPLELQLFEEGSLAFRTPLTEADGLGPIFNEASCSSCHNQPAFGGFGTRRVTRFGVSATPTQPFDPLVALGGSLLQDQSLDLMCRELVPAAANHVAQRGTPICFGSGLIEAIPDSVIVARAAQQPPGLSGVVRFVQPLESPLGVPRAGRFGWKGGVATVQTFSLDAALNELGLTSVILPNENAPNGNAALLAMCDTVPDPEDLPDPAGFTAADRFTHFQRYLAPPPQTPRSGMSGELVFEQIGCAECHVSTYVTGVVAEAALSGRTIKPYSDFLLHDMGTLGDGIVDGPADEQQMMTRALWGMRYRNAFLHDGRAAGGGFDVRVAAAVAAHDGEGAASRAAFQALSSADRDRLVAFLDSLGRAEFDWDVNNRIDEFDWFFLEPLVTGPAPAVAVTPDDPGALCDVDQDGDFDLVELGQVQRVWSGATAAPGPVAHELDLAVTSGGQPVVFAAPGATLDYAVRGELSSGASQGLAMFAFDLAFSGGPLGQADAPAAGPLQQFVAPLGMGNPAGYGGTLVPGAVAQIGGAQNTIANTFAPVPVGAVATGVASAGAPIDLATGTLTAPLTPGVYRLTVSNVFANVLVAPLGGSGIWSVGACEPGVLGTLVVHVVDCAPRVICQGKVNSLGCTPAVAFAGTASLGGPATLTLGTTELVNGQFGVFLWSHAEDSRPFLGGTLCLADPIHRHATPATGGSGAPGTTCLGSLRETIDGAFLQANGFLPGDTLVAQWLYRDVAHPDGTGAGITPAVRVSVCP